MSKKRYTVILEPGGVHCEAQEGMSLLAVLQKKSISIDASCGGSHTCGKCRVRVLKPQIEPTDLERSLLMAEDLAKGVRLACEQIIREDMVVELFENSKPQIVTETSDVLHEEEDKLFRETTKGLGAAIDLGTTTLAAYLYDLSTGKRIAAASMLNPQIGFGDDVISRIAYCGDDAEKIQTLQNLIVDAIHTLLIQLVDPCTSTLKDIVRLILVGNTVMEHIFLGISPSCLGRAPFEPAVKAVQVLSPDVIGIPIATDGKIIFLSAASGFVGADHMAVLVAVNPLRYKENVLVIDIGTNSEICLCSEGKLYVTSCATGPALEGAQIRCGIRACDGAIDHVKIDPHSLQVKLHILGEQKNPNIRPIGICGSGILDTVSELVKCGIVERDGRFSPRSDSSVLSSNSENEKEFILWQSEDKAEKIAIYQSDIQAIQLAKAALYAGIKILQKKSGTERIDRIFLAGGFGYYLDISQVMRLGMLPDMPMNKIHVVGNAAGEGAVRVLLQEERLDELSEIAEKIVFINSAADKDFSKCYADAMIFPHRRDAFPLTFHVNWECPGRDTHFLPDAVWEKEFSCLENAEALEALLPLIAKYNEDKAYILPIIQNQEACVFGAEITRKARYWAPGVYPYDSLEEFQLFLQGIPTGYLLEDSRTRAVLETVAHIKAKNGAPIILEVQAPFSLLCALIEPRKVFAAVRRKNTNELEEIMKRLTEELGLYLEQVVKQGCTLISAADPLGSIRLNGEKFFCERIALWQVRFLQRCRRILKNAVMHLCGQMSADLLNTGFVQTYPIRMRKESDYLDSLLEIAEDSRIRYAGLGCIRCQQEKKTLLYGLELTEPR